MKKILKKLAIGVVAFFVVIIGIAFIFGKPSEEIIAEYNKRIEILNEEKEYIENVDSTLTELAEEMYNLSTSIVNDMDNNSLNTVDVLSKYKAIGDKAIINTEKISYSPLGISITTIKKNIVDYVKLSMDGITYMDFNKIATAAQYMENVTNEIDNYKIAKEEALNKIDEQIEVIENDIKSLQ